MFDELVIKGEIFEDDVCSKFKLIINDVENCVLDVCKKFGLDVEFVD